MKTYSEIEKLGTIIHIDEWLTRDGEEVFVIGAVDGYEPGIPSTLMDMGERECFSEVTAWASPVGIHEGVTMYKEIFDMDLLDEIERVALEHYS